jgi:hypothetical protein
VLATELLAAVPLVPVGLVLDGLAAPAADAWSSMNFGSLAAAPAVPLVPVAPAGARWTHPVTVTVAGLELLLCGVVCAVIPTDRSTTTAADAPDRTIVLILPPLLLQDRVRKVQR